MASSGGEGHENAPSSILLGVRGYRTAHSNATTARSRTSTGHPIEVSFCATRPPAISHFSVHCPGLQLPPADQSLAPKAIAADAGLVLLRVPIDPLGRYFHEHNDYFVYTARHQLPKLDLLPPPCESLGDNEVAVLADSEKQCYVVAALRPLSGFTFTLHLYRSKPGAGAGETGSWTFQPVSVVEQLRDRVCPVPDTAERLMYHLTTKVITLGGARGTVGWVDLWRGILLCNVLEEQSPKLRDMPLPLPASGNWGFFLSSCERFCRDITVSQHKDFIKYVEMEIASPRMVTTWSMPIPVTSWDDWHRDCTAKMGDLRVDNPRRYELLHELTGSISDKEAAAKEATLSLGGLGVAYPIFSLDDNVVYLLTKASAGGRVVVAVDVCRKMMRGVSKLDSERDTSFAPCYIASGISRHLDTGSCARCCVDCSGCRLCQIKMGISHVACEPKVTTTRPNGSTKGCDEVVSGSRA